MTKLIVNADDFGYSRATNYGILDAHLDGILTSATLMANMPGFDHAVAISKAYPKLGVGVHLVLTCDGPLLDTHKTIVGADGKFFSNPGVIAELPDGALDVEEVYAEWKAQIEKVLAAGITPTHLDSHHHSATLPVLIPIFARLAKEYNLPVRGKDVDFTDLGLTSTAHFEGRFDGLGYHEAGEYEATPEEITAYLDEVYEAILANESIEIMTHPAYIDTKLYRNSSFQLQRLGEMDYLTTHAFAEKIKNDPRITLATFADL